MATRERLTVRKLYDKLSEIYDKLDEPDYGFPWGVFSVGVLTGLLIGAAVGYTLVRFI